LAEQRAAIEELVGLCRKIAAPGRPACAVLEALYRTEELLIPRELEASPDGVETAVTFEEDETDFWAATIGFPAIRRDGREYASYDSGERAEWAGDAGILFFGVDRAPTASFGFPRADDEELTAAAVRRLRRTTRRDVRRVATRLEDGGFRALVPLPIASDVSSDGLASPFVFSWWVDEADPSIAHWWVRQRGPGAIVRRGSQNVTLDPEQCAMAILAFGGHLQPSTGAVLLGYYLGDPDGSEACDYDDEGEAVLIPPEPDSAE